MSLLVRIAIIGSVFSANRLFFSRSYWISS